MALPFDSLIQNVKFHVFEVGDSSDLKIVGYNETPQLFNFSFGTAFTELCSRVVNTPNLNLGGSDFESRPGYPLS